MDLAHISSIFGRRSIHDNTIVHYGQYIDIIAVAACIMGRSHQGALFRIRHILRGIPRGLDWILPEFESLFMPEL